MGLDRDLTFVAGDFANTELPKEKKYLLKYFDTVLQETFLKYVFLFGDYKNFVDHTGLVCQPHWRKKLYNRIKQLEALHKEAKSNGDIQTLAKIESGKYKL